RDFVVKLAKARACSEALRRGTYRTLFADSENLIYERKADSGDAAIVTISRAPVSTTLAVPLPGISSGDYRDLLEGGTASLKPELTNIPTTPFSVHVYVPREGACAAGN
ncbi:MAG: hypothetical protein ABI551_14275, partial [Polyangiaceae bacterium]